MEEIKRNEEKNQEEINNSNQQQDTKENEMDIELQELKKNEKKTKEELKKQKELLLRTAAEYDNYRKRSEKEKLAVYNDAVAKTIELLLPAIDSIDIAKQNMENVPDEYKRGLELIINQIKTSFERIGIKECGKEGEKFDPRYHNAVMHIEDENLGENTIAEVLQKGYIISDKVIRPAMVKVAN